VPKVLDVGCGNGLLLKVFIGQGWDAYGIDPSPWSESMAKRYGFKLHKGFLEENQIAPNFFDVVTSTSTLEHIPNLILHLRAIFRVLRPGGVAYFVGMPSYGSAIVRLNLSSFHHNEPPWHANFFTYEDLKRLFSHPKLCVFIQKLFVNSYAVPEAHRLYNWANNLRIRKNEAISLANQ
jgi:SAM-dependent methyltransferase